MITSITYFQLSKLPMLNEILLSDNKLKVIDLGGNPNFPKLKVIDLGKYFTIQKGISSNKLRDSIKNPTS